MQQSFPRLILIVLFLIFLSACTLPPTPAPTLMSQLSLAQVPFTSADFGYSLRYPQGWATEEGDEPGVIIFLDNRVKPASGELPAFPVTVTVLAGTRSALGLPQGELTSPAVLNPLLDKMWLGMKIEPQSLRSSSLAGKPAVRLDVSGTLNTGAPLVGLVVVADPGNRVWSIFALAPADEWVGFAPFFEQMVMSVSFTEK